MSIFNSVVKPHQLAPVLTFLIDWGYKKYPLAGRIRYVWVTEDFKKIKLLLKDAPSSWSKNPDEIMAQIKSHEAFVSVEVYKKDPVYLIATFNPIKEQMDMVKMKHPFEKTIFEANESLMEEGIISLTKDPFVIFHERLEDFDKNPENNPELIDDSAKLLKGFLDKTYSEYEEISYIEIEEKYKKAILEESFELAGELNKFYKEKYKKNIPN